MKRQRESHLKERPTKMIRVQGDYQRGRETLKSQKELKAFDVAGISETFVTPAAAINYVVFNTMVNGAELYQRVGRKIYMKSLHLRGNIFNTATAAQDNGRIIVFYDSQPNAAILGIGDLIKDSNAAAATTGFSHLNLNNRERFKILRDFNITLPSVTLAMAVQTNVGQYDQDNNFTINMHIKLKGLEAIFNATNGGTIADITSGALIAVFVSNNQSNTWTFEGNSRLRYYD